MFCLALLVTVSVAAEDLHPLAWSDAVFAQAKREDKFVLLDLGAVWCHWCHVMEETTYADKDVIALLKKKYLFVQVDQDARPDLANRYEDYGWPATIVFAADGSEIVKRRGFINPREMTSLLQAIIDDPSPGPSVIAEKKAAFKRDSKAANRQSVAWKKSWKDGYDFKMGGWEGNHRWLDWDNVEFALESSNDPDAEKMAKQMLRLQRKLLDPVWGGMYQYSAEGDWDHPHFEKIMQVQAENLRVYALAFERWGNAEDLRVAREIHRYLRTFLTSPEGMVYTSQDADLVQGEHAGDYFAMNDVDRRAKGIPRVDQHIYARENGWVIAALVEMFAATDESKFLVEALTAAQWVISHRSMPGGGFRHDEKDAAGPFLGDTLAMGRAFLRLYAATGDRAWLARSEEAASFITKNFLRSDGEPGLLTARASGEMAAPKPQFDENVAAARFANLLWRHTGKSEHRHLAELAFRFAASPQIVERRGAFVGALILAGMELDSEPLHVVVVGGKKDSDAEKLIHAALHAPAIYKQVQWYDHNEGPLPGPDQQFPSLKGAAAFICADGACSPPVTDLADLTKRLLKAGPEKKSKGRE